MTASQRINIRWGLHCLTASRSRFSCVARVWCGWRLEGTWQTGASCPFFLHSTPVAPWGQRHPTTKRNVSCELQVWYLLSKELQARPPTCPHSQQNSPLAYTQQLPQEGAKTYTILCTPMQTPLPQAFVARKPCERKVCPSIQDAGLATSQRLPDTVVGKLQTIREQTTAAWSMN